MKKVSIVILALAAVAATPLAQAPESTTQMKLAKSPEFLERIQYLGAQTARNVLEESQATACHAERVALARNFINFPAEYAAKAAVTVVGGVNVIGTVTVTPAVADDPETPENEATPEVVTTSVTDGALFSQIQTFWNALAGCDTGS